MAGELYSRPLSEEARLRLTDFIEAYAYSMNTQIVDHWAEEAKRKALVLLQTDIDILVFVVAIHTMYSKGGVALLTRSLHGLLSPRDVATALVRIVEEGLRRDKQKRTS